MEAMVQQAQTLHDNVGPSQPPPLLMYKAQITMEPQSR